MDTVMILANNDIGLYNFRKELIEELLKQQYKVVILLPRGERVRDLEAMGCVFVETELSRHGMNPIQERKLMKFYKQIIKMYKPDLICSYTIKPNIYGGFAAAQCKVPYIANITGLGTAIESGGIVGKMLISLYKRALKNAECVFFQNKSNMEFMEEKGIRAKQIKMLPGSGVNLHQHAYEVYPDHGNKIQFLFVGRLMRDKGVIELIEAARFMYEKYPNVRFCLVGGCEKEFQTVLDQIDLPECVELCGQQKDVHSYMKQADAIVLPSYHEGMANVLLEAAACGRPVLASNVPGCRETFDEGRSGYGFQAKDVRSLVQALEKFISLSQSEREEMGLAGRKKMEKEFDRKIIIHEYMKLIQKI